MWESINHYPLSSNFQPVLYLQDCGRECWELSWSCERWYSLVPPTQFHTRSHSITAGKLWVKYDLPLEINSILTVSSDLLHVWISAKVTHSVTFTEPKWGSVPLCWLFGTLWSWVQLFFSFIRNLSQYPKPSKLWSVFMQRHWPVSSDRAHQSPLDLWQLSSHIQPLIQSSPTTESSSLPWTLSLSIEDWQTLLVRIEALSTSDCVYFIKTPVSQASGPCFVTKVGLEVHGRLDVLH